MKTSSGEYTLAYEQVCHKSDTSLNSPDASIVQNVYIYYVRFDLLTRPSIPVVKDILYVYNKYAVHPTASTEFNVRTIYYRGLLRIEEHGN